MNGSPASDERLLSVAEAAAVVGKSARWLRREIDEGRVAEVTRVGASTRFTRAQLDALIASWAHRPRRTRPAAGPALAGDAVPAVGAEVFELTPGSARRHAARAVSR